MGTGMARKQTREKRADYSRNYVSAPENQPKIRARDILHYAVRKGKITRRPCEKCGAPKTQAHHADYAKPLEVKWLCQPCHGAEHTGGFCLRGHTRTPENISDKYDCRECMRIRARLRYWRQRAASELRI